jgi:hypothetical protein
MFDLDKAVAAWRKNLRAAGMENRTLLDELENHLREEVERQRNCGSTELRAFEIAVRQIGDAGQLKSEFKKISQTPVVLERIMIGISILVVGFGIFLSTVMIVLCLNGWGDRLVASVAVVCALVVAYGWRHAVPFLPVIAGAGKRCVVGFGCIAAGVGVCTFFVNVVIPRFQTDSDHPLPAIGLWLIFIIAVFCCLGQGLMLDERERERLGIKKLPPAAS